MPEVWLAELELDLLIHEEDFNFVGISETWLDHSYDWVEYLWLELQREETNGKLIVRVCYKSPNLKDDKKTDFLSQIGMEVRQGNVIVMGDFSYPDNDWAEGTAHSSKACHFLNVLHDNFMSQLVDALTRNNALLDLLITNKTELIADVEVRDNL